MTAPTATLRRKAAQVCGNVHNVGFRQVGHRLLHELRSDAGSFAVLKNVKLTREVDWMHSREPGHVRQSAQVVTMTDNARNRLTSAAVFHQILSLRNAADRHIRNESGMRIAISSLTCILRQCDDPVSDR